MASDRRYVPALEFHIFTDWATAIFVCPLCCVQLVVEFSREQQKGRENLAPDPGRTDAKEKKAWTTQSKSNMIYSSYRTYSTKSSF